MEFYLSYPKSDKGVMSIYDTNTCMLIAVNTKTVEEAENWINDNYYEILKRISVELGI